MEVNFERIQELIQQPQESLSVELKAWIDPGQPDGIAKIVKTALAMRNHGGGYIVFGFDNKTLAPLLDGAPSNVREMFHIDKIQGMIAKYSSELFEVTVEFPQRDGRDFPVIIIPTDIKTPVVAKLDLSSNGNGKPLIRADTVYVRSLSSNNTPSTTQAKSKDWSRLIEVCFDNREADIGRFMRRHLSGLKPELVREFAAIALAIEPEASAEDLLNQYLQEGNERFKVMAERSASLPEHGTWEVALLVLGDVPTHSSNQQFLNLLDSSNPDYTGWPVWLDSRSFTDESARPFVFEGVWEAFVASVESSRRADHVDYMRLDPKGRFYLRRALQDDIYDSSPKPFSVLDFSLPVIRTAEAIAVGIAFVKAMGCDPERTLLAFAFRWTRLQGRELGSWAQPGRYISPGRHAYQDDVIVFVRVPLETPLSALSEYVNQVVQPLYEVFDGFSLGKDIVEDLTRRLVERRL